MTTLEIVLLCLLAAAVLVGVCLWFAVYQLGKMVEATIKGFWK